MKESANIQSKFEKVKELNEKIGDLLTDGYDCVTVSNQLNVPLVWVENVHDALFESEEYNDSMDGDFDSAMASAGYGMDEDYGYYGE